MLHVLTSFFWKGNMAASNQRNLSIIALKLTAIMGITWILGLVLAFYSTLYLEYPFVILNSFQGELKNETFLFLINSSRIIDSTHIQQLFSSVLLYVNHAGSCMGYSIKLHTGNFLPGFNPLPFHIPAFTEKVLYSRS